MKVETRAVHITASNSPRLSQTLVTNENYVNGMDNSKDSKSDNPQNQVDANVRIACALVQKDADWLEI